MLPTSTGHLQDEQAGGRLHSFTASTPAVLAGSTSSARPPLDECRIETSGIPECLAAQSRTVSARLRRPELGPNYIIPALAKALQILNLQESAECLLNVNEITKSTGIAKTTAYRILRTLSAFGYLPEQSVYDGRRPTGQNLQAGVHTKTRHTLMTNPRKHFVRSDKRDYIIPVLVNALTVISLLKSAERSLNLNQICDQTGIAKTTVYRILRTLSAFGYLPQGEHGVYGLRRKSVFSTSSALEPVYPSFQDEDPPAS